MNIIKDILDIMMNICLAMHFIIKFRELKKKARLHRCFLEDIS